MQVSGPPAVSSCRDCSRYPSFLDASSFKLRGQSSCYLISRLLAASRSRGCSVVIKAPGQLMLKLLSKLQEMSSCHSSSRSYPTDTQASGGCPAVTQAHEMSSCYPSPGGAQLLPKLQGCKLHLAGRQFSKLQGPSSCYPRSRS
jgi:hypothetical protein